MKVLILGLGQYPQGSGVEAAVFFAKRGDEVIATDLKSAEELSVNVKRLSKYKNVRFLLGEHRLEDVDWADIVVPNPRVRPESPFFQEAVRLNKQIESDISVFMAHCAAPVIGVTGTRGKSTTSTLVAELLKADQRTVWLGGNILVSPLAFLAQVKSKDWVVLELSSWQLELTGRKGVSPAYAIWTNLMRDHLNTYSGMEAYGEAKAQIFKHQSPDGVVFLPVEKSFDAYAKSAPGKVIRVGSVNEEAGRLVKSSALKMKGDHNQRNAEFAVALAREVGVKPSTIRGVLQTFPGIANRQEEIADIEGVRYINDTTATTPDATIAALKTFATDPRQKQKPTIHLIFGGADKELEFEEVAGVMKQQKLKIYLLPGTAHDKIARALQAHRVAWSEVEDLQVAMKHIESSVKRGDIVLLSPGCASFGLFKNEFHRGEEFAAIVKSLEKKVV